MFPKCYLNLQPLTNPQRGFVDQEDCDLDVFEQSTSQI